MIETSLIRGIDDVFDVAYAPFGILCAQRRTELSVVDPSKSTLFFGHKYKTKEGER